jgi:hypothetical protein
MTRILLLAAVVVAALALAGSALAASAPTRLNGTVGPGFTISLNTAAGKKVAKLKAGRYRITIDDRASIHNFHLTGPGVNKDSGVAFTGKKTWTVTFRKGTYNYVCDPHASGMNGKFAVS